MSWTYPILLLGWSLKESSRVAFSPGGRFYERRIRQRQRRRMGEGCCRVRRLRLLRVVRQNRRRTWDQANPNRQTRRRSCGGRRTQMRTGRWPRTTLDSPQPKQNRYRRGRRRRRQRLQSPRPNRFLPSSLSSSRLERYLWRKPNEFRLHPTPGGRPEKLATRRAQYRHQGQRT